MESNINSYQEQVLFHYILSDQIYLQSSESDFFSNQILKDSFEIAKEHALKYKEAPSKDQFFQLVKIKGLEGKLSDDIVTALYNTKQILAQYDDQWLKDNVGGWIQMRKLETVMRKAVAYMKTTKANAENAGDIVEKVRHMLSTETAVNFNFKISSDFFDPNSHLQTRLSRTTTGYNFIDLCLKGGYWKGSFIMFMGGPKSGKSTWLCNLAAKSVMGGFNTAYATLELQTEIVNMRIGANLLNIPVDDYETLVKDQDLLKKKLSNLKESSFIPPGQLRVQEFPTSTLSVNDLEAWLLKEQEILGIKYDNVFIDYLNIMKNWRNPNSENLYMKIKQISEDLRAMAMRNNWCVISVTQTNRCLDPDTLVEHRENGKIKLSSVKIGDYILSDDGFVKIKNIWQNDKTKTYKIKTKSGKEIICSKNHIFPVNNEFKPLKDIKVGDILYTKNSKS